MRLRDTGAFAAARAAVAGGVVAADEQAFTLGLATGDDAAAMRSLLDLADPDRSRPAAFSVRTATLDDVFDAVTGRGTAAQETDDRKEPAPV